MKKVKIKSLPQTTKYKGGGSAGPITGDQMNFGLYTNQGVIGAPDSSQTIPGVQDVRGTYPEVDRKDANIEVEKGEVVVSPDLGTIYRVAGNKHSKGGTPIKAKEGSYIISDFINTDHSIKEALGFDSDPKNKKKETWAEFANKQVDPKYYNSLAAIISDKEKDKDVDPYSYNTAKIKLPEYQEIMSKIALGNEMSKAKMGKDFTIPQIAMPALQSLANPVPKEGQQPLVEARMGGNLSQFWDGGDNPWDPRPYLGGKTTAGSITPTGLSNRYKAGPQYYKDWATVIPGVDKMSDGDAQNAIYAYSARHNPAGVNRMWDTYGLNAKGMNNLDQRTDTHVTHGIFDSSKPMGSADLGIFQSAYADGFSGARDLQRLDTGTIPTGRTPFQIPGTPQQFQGRMPNINYNPGTPIDEQPSISQRPRDPLQFSNSTPYKQNPNAFEEMGLLSAMGNPINTYYPWAAKPDVSYINGQFDDPNYYPIQSAQRQRMDMVNQLSSPTTARAMGSYQPDQISGIIQETQRARGNNLQVANTINAQNSQIYNNNSSMMAGINTDLYNKTVMTQEQRDIARRLKSNDVRGAAQNMVRNMTQMQYLHAMNPQYSMTGPFWNNLQFTGGKSLTGSSNGGGSQPMSRDQFIAQNPGYGKLVGTTDEFKIDDAMRQERLREEAMMFRSSNNFNQNMVNPYVAAMLNSSGGYPPGFQ